MGNCCGALCGEKKERDPASGEAAYTQFEDAKAPAPAEAPARDFVFSKAAQEAFDAVSASRSKLRDRTLKADGIARAVAEAKEQLANLKRVCEATPGAAGDDVILVARALASLGLSLAADNVSQHDESQLMQQESLDVYRRFFGPRDNELVASALDRVGVASLNRGRRSDAVPVLTEALAMRRRLTRGRDNADLAATLNSLASALDGVGRDVEARELQSEALAIHRRLHAEKALVVPTSDVPNRAPQSAAGAIKLSETSVTLL
jgi:hypothetical protein